MSSADYERLARAMQQIDQARVKDSTRLSDAVNRIAQTQAEAVARQQLDGIKEILTHTYGKAQTYTNIVTAAGYAAFFSMWASIRNDLPRQVMLLAGLLMTVSVSLFVIAEIHKMATSASYFKSLHQKLAEEPTLNLVEETKNYEKAHAEKQYRAWLLLFYPCLVTGVLAGALLAGCFVVELLKELAK